MAKLLPWPDAANTAMLGFGCWPTSNGATLIGSFERIAAPSRYPPGSEHPASTQGKQVAAAVESTSLLLARGPAPMGSVASAAFR